MRPTVLLVKPREATHGGTALGGVVESGRRRTREVPQGAIARGGPRPGTGDGHVAAPRRDAGAAGVVLPGWRSDAAYGAWLRAGWKAYRPPHRRHVAEKSVTERGPPLLAVSCPLARHVPLESSLANPGHRAASATSDGPLMKRFSYRVNRLLDRDPSYYKASVSASRLCVPKGNSGTQVYEPFVEYRRLARRRDQPGRVGATAVEGIDDS
jgi:hypothetical protein